MNKFAPLSPKVSALLHGADYNPEQWENYPGTVESDIAMMQQAKCNVMSVGIFSWAKLEPEEGMFRFEWLDEIIDKLYQGGIHVFLATPSGARPAWMSQKYPQVLRV
ncbi:MAG: beta-galactosidase, partial [Cronobacter sakazakii]|nr:beta-galactosidase [Cronobacter sakazakii]